LEGAGRDLENIRRQYKQGVKNYSQVQQSLMMLDRKVKHYQVALDADRAIDAAGNVRRRR